MPGPAYHARTHLPGGTDPLRGLLPAAGGDFEGTVLNISGLRGYWRLGETAEPWRDISGYDLVEPADLTLQGIGTALTPDVTGALAFGDDGAVEFNYNGTDPEGGQYLEWEGDPERFDFTGEFTVVAFVNVNASLDDRRGVIIGTTSYAAGPAMRGFGLHVIYPEGSIRFSMGQVGAGPERYVSTDGGVTPGQWYFVAASWDETTMRLWVDADLIGETETATPPGGGPIRIGFSVIAEAETAGWLHGTGDEAAVWGRALTQNEINTLYQAGISETGGFPGEVVTIDEDGDPDWQPPGVEVEHGGGEPDEGPVTRPGSGSFDGPPSASGWEYVTHREILVLYDSTPARFDVPSRKWTRVPFNTARIQRTWELEPNGNFRTAWLPDDRGVTAAAKDGVLKITADMLFDFGAFVPAYPNSDEQWLSGWYSIEYPVLDHAGLPRSDPPTSDAYVRAARLLNTRTGRVVSTAAGRAFYQWHFSTEASGGGAFPADYPVDNPYPIYPAWPARPMTKPLPYPQMSPSDSLTYYQTEVGNPGFGGLNHPLNVTMTSLVAGDTFVLQAWQDTPWPLRFSTDHFPNHRGFAAVGPWMNQPWLSLEYYYDPETIDHTTGRLL